MKTFQHNSKKLELVWSIARFGEEEIPMVRLKKCIVCGRATRKGNNYAHYKCWQKLTYTSRNELEDRISKILDKYRETKKQEEYMEVYPHEMLLRYTYEPAVRIEPVDPQPLPRVVRGGLEAMNNHRN